MNWSAVLGFVTGTIIPAAYHYYVKRKWNDALTKLGVNTDEFLAFLKGVKVPSVPVKKDENVKPK